MKSDVILVGSDGKGLVDALNQVESVAVFKGLSEKDSLHLRLLAEEMLGMLRAIVGDVDADFWLEDEKKYFQLHLKAETLMDPEKREALLGASTSGKNQAARGIIGKLRDIFAEAIEARNADVPLSVYDDWRFESGMSMGGNMPMMAYAGGWSLNQYRSSLTRNHLDAWDELEKSVLAKLADEVQIFIQGTTVEMVIFKKIK